jgi:hypothetical protein
MDNPFVIPVAGQADWDSSLTADLNTIERGYHFTERAGAAINTGNIVWLNSGGFAFPFDPNSKTIYPHGMAYTATASGDSAVFVAWGIVRSLGINSPAIPGFPLYVSALTPGLVVTTPNGPKIGRGLTGYGVLFQPHKSQRLAELFDVNTNGVADAAVLTWSDSSSKWAPAAIPGIGTAGVTVVRTLTAGAAVNSGHVVWLDPSNNQAKHFDPNSESIEPIGVAITQGTGAGSMFTALLKGVIGMAITSAVPIGRHAYVSALTPGVMVSSYAAAFRAVGRNVGSQAIEFDAMAREHLPEQLTSSIAISAVTGSLHLFSASAGRWGWNRQTVMIGNSADHVELKWYSDSARSKLLYSTVSGGVTVVGSFQDRAGWPFENTDASTLGDLVYGSVKVLSSAAVGSDTVSIQQTWDRHR